MKNEHLRYPEDVPKTLEKCCFNLQLLVFKSKFFFSMKTNKNGRKKNHTLCNKAIFL